MDFNGKWILDENGIPTPEPDVLKWAKWYEGSGEQRRVALTHISDTVKVSTVFLGLDHSWDGPPPLLWETMIFGGPLNETMWRYRSRELAEAGHAEAVLMAKAGAKAGALL